jgi:uncharacterized protein YhaN
LRLRRFKLECYGNFADSELQLADAPGCINLVVAPNGAGKSVLRHAVSELLFGIHPRTPMGFRFDYARMRLTAAAVFADGQSAGFVRRKGNANTLIGDDGAPLPHAILARMPREGDRKRLEQLFVLDSAQLRAGGRALLQTDGDLADALLSGAGELGSARSLAADLAERRDDAAPTRRNARAPFYEACDAWTKAGAALNDALVRPPEIAEQERLRQDAVAARDGALARGRAAAAELARVSRIRSTRRHLEALDEAAAWLAANPDAPALPAAAGPALIAAKQAGDDAARALQGATEQLARLAAEREAVTVDDAVLAAAAAIARLAAAAAVAQQAASDIPKRAAELAEATRAIAALLRELASPADPADARAELRSAADIATARALIAEAAERAAQRTAARTKLAQEQERLEEVAAELAALPAATATDALQAVLEEATAEGDPARLARDAEAALQKARAEERASLARIPGGGQDLARPVPADATWTRLEAGLTAAQAAAEAAEARRRTLQAELDAATSRLAALTGTRTLPDEAALAASRSHRDRGWALIFARLTGVPDSAAEAAYAPGLALPLAFERAMAEADAIADRRAEESERLGQAATLRAAITRADAALRTGTEEAARRAEDAGRARAAWAAAAAAIGLPEDVTAAEVRAFTAAREAALAAQSVVTVAERAAASLRERQADWAARLAAALGTLPGPLPALIATARLRLREAEELAVRRAALVKTETAARRAALRAAPASEQAEQAMAAWAARWDAVLAALRRPPGEPPAVTADVLDRLVALPAKVAAADTAQTRLDEMRKQRGDFERDATELARQLADPGGDPAAVAQRLGARLVAARAAQASRETLEGQAKTAAARHRDALAATARAQALMAAALAAVGAATVEQAEHLLAQAAERRRHEAAQAEALRLLREDGDGLPLAALRSEVAATPAAAIAETMQSAQAAADAANEAAQQAAAAIATAEGAIARLAAGRDAAGAAAARQAAAARLAHVLEDALVQHLAATMLDHALAEVEASGGTNQRLQRIGETFALLTGGAYTSVSPAGEDAESREHGRLIAHTADGADCHIGRLSEGTRDQLYLALRLVAIEDHVRASAALPFIADDVLQTFDDTRARTAMEALVALSHHVQVIVLTHHPHLLQIAQGLPVHEQRL